MDLVRVETHTQVIYSFLSIGWGFIADIDIESERLRMLGSPRFTIWSIARLIGKNTEIVATNAYSIYRIVVYCEHVLGLRSYPGRLSYCKINNLETEVKMNNFTISTLDDFLEPHVEDESVSIEFGMDPVMMMMTDLHVDHFLSKIKSLLMLICVCYI